MHYVCGFYFCQMNQLTVHIERLLEFAQQRDEVYYSLFLIQKTYGFRWSELAPERWEYVGGLYFRVDTVKRGNPRIVKVEEENEIATKIYKKQIVHHSFKYGIARIFHEEAIKPTRIFYNKKNARLPYLAALRSKGKIQRRHDNLGNIAILRRQNSKCSITLHKLNIYNNMTNIIEILKIASSLPVYSWQMLGCSSFSGFGVQIKFSLSFQITKTIPLKDLLQTSYNGLAVGSVERID